MSISQEITRIQNAKADLKTSINAKTDNEHQITDETIDEYADFVGSITSGGASKYAPRGISFYYYTGTELDYEIENLDTQNITNMDVMFSNCSNLTSLDLSTFDTSNVTSMAYMFDSCSKLTSLDLSTFDASELTRIDYMFNRCRKLMFLDIRTFDFTQITSYINLVGTASNNGPPNNCLIIVKDNTAKSVITTNFSRLTNVKTVAEYEASL